MKETFNKTAVIGTGLMGGSLAMAIRACDSVGRVVCYDSSPYARSRAAEIGICDEVADSATSAAGGADVLFLATPVGVMPAVAEEVADALKEGAIVSDVGSTKLRLTELIESALPERAHYIGGHPMTGSEQFGIDSAREDLYRDRYFILTPTSRTDAGAFQRLHGLLTQIGARVISMDPETHDRAMATVSHVPHLLSLILMEMAERQREQVKNLFTIAAGGFRDMTRIAASSPDLWIDVCMENREFIVERLLEYGFCITELVDIIDRGDKERLRRKFERARRARVEMSVKPGTEIEQLFELALPVPDEPGIISTISTALGSVGINIEDISIVHPLEGEQGVLKLKILGEDNARLAARELLSRGFKAGVGKV